MADRPGPVLVTGANSGFGLAATLRLAARGWTTWGTVRSRAKAKVLSQAAKDADVSARVRPLLLDVSDHEAVVARWATLPPFYAVVNNAGYSELGAIEEVSAAEAKRQLDVNLIAPAVVSACALPAMRERGAGRIVMVSSVAGRAAVLPLNGWYHASKFGLEALSDVLRIEVAPFGVKVVIIEPGFFKTGIVGRAAVEAVERGRAADSPYRDAYARIEKVVGLVSAMAPAANAVAGTIVTAVEARWPVDRYLVGLDAHALAFLDPVVPRVLTDTLARAVAGLHR